MISYKIVNHVPGRIRMEVPLLKGISKNRLMDISRQLYSMEIPEGVKDIRLNPYTGSVVIIYAHEKIDILRYIKDFESNTEMFKNLKLIF